MAEDYPTSREGSVPSSVPQEGQLASPHAAGSAAKAKGESTAPTASTSGPAQLDSQARTGMTGCEHSDVSPPVRPPHASEEGGKEEEEEEEGAEEEGEGSQDKSSGDGEYDEEAQRRQGNKAEDADNSVVLSPHTKVVVIGNNRTKPDMVGKRGCIKKSVGLGGWHFLRLTNGEEVKLQRNALSVVELPTGNEPAFSDDEEPESAAKMVVSSRKRRIKAVGGGEVSGRVAGKRNVSSEVKQPSRETNVDFSKLDIGNLRKYRRHYRLNDVPPNSSKDQLVTAVTRHFRMQTVDEGMVMSQFYRAIQKHGAEVA